MLLRLSMIAGIALTLLVACLPARPMLVLGDTVIDGTASWSNEVLIGGTVTVKKGGSLTIRPGTRIRFERIDHDNDGIGDAELYVEGTLVAQGTPAAPILFTSAAADPKPADWKFLYLDYARPAELSHLIVEYAYSGVQIHFGKARILDSEFRYNVDGVRFSTANIEVAGNFIHHNTHGLRFEERRGSGNIHHNEIRDNQIGIFAVTRGENRTRFAENNLVNQPYNVKLGLDQAGDLTFPRNWWGTLDPAAIRAGFFDHDSDRALGRVSAPDPLAAPIDRQRRPLP